MAEVRPFPITRRVGAAQRLADQAVNMDADVGALFVRREVERERLRLVALGVDPSVAEAEARQLNAAVWHIVIDFVFWGAGAGVVSDADMPADAAGASSEPARAPIVSEAPAPAVSAVHLDAWLDQVLHDPSLRRLAQHLALTIHGHVCLQSGCATRSQSQLMADLGCSDGGLRSAIRQLQAAGHIDVRAPKPWAVSSYYPIIRAGCGR